MLIDPPTEARTATPPTPSLPYITEEGNNATLREVAAYATSPHHPLAPNLDQPNQDDRWQLEIRASKNNG